MIVELPAAVAKTVPLVETATAGSAPRVACCFTRWASTDPIATVEPNHSRPSDRSATATVPAPIATAASVGTATLAPRVTVVGSISCNSCADRSSMAGVPSAGSWITSTEPLTVNAESSWPAAGLIRPTSDLSASATQIDRFTGTGGCCGNPGWWAATTPTAIRPRTDRAATDCPIRPRAGPGGRGPDAGLRGVPAMPSPLSILPSRQAAARPAGAGRLRPRTRVLPRRQNN